MIEPSWFSPDGPGGRSLGEEEGRRSQREEAGAKNFPSLVPSGPFLALRRRIGTWFRTVPAAGLSRRLPAAVVDG